MAKRFKYSWTGLLTAFFLVFSTLSYAQGGDSGEKDQAQSQAKAEGEEEFDANKVILEHVKDAHTWHFFSINDHEVSLPLPVIIYVPKTGFSIFMSSRFHHGATAYKGFRMLTPEYIEEYNLSSNSYFPGSIIAVHADESPNLFVPVYDLSLTRNVLQAMLSMLLLILIFVGLARKYSRNPNKAPSGFQNAVEPVILFIRDDVARPYLGDKADKYLPFLLSIFFFIWVNSLLSLIPGSANVAGNLAFTGVLADRKSVV